MAESAALTGAEAAAILPDPWSLGGMRWPHLAVGLLAALGVLLLLRSQAALERGGQRVGDLVSDVGDRAKEALRVNALSSMLSDASSGSATRVRVTLGFDWSVRPALQRALERLTASEPGSDLSRRNLYQGLLEEFHRSLLAVRYAFIEEAKGNTNETERLLTATANDLRSRYTHETAGRGRAQVEVSARALEGHGLLIITVLLGLNESEGERDPIGSWAPLSRLVERLREIDVVPMIEVIWSPAKENDRLSSAELEVLYPELERVGDALLGRVGCESCRAVYAAELGACPSCGASSAMAAKQANAAPCPYCGHPLPAHETHCEKCGAFVEAPAPP